MHQKLVKKTEIFFQTAVSTEEENSTIFLIKDYIGQKYMNETLSVKDISDHVFLSTSYVCTFFKNETGQTLNQYLTEYRMEKAKQLLAEAGYPDGFTMTITVPSNYTQHVETAEVVSQQLAQVGITANLNPIEWESWISDVYTGRQFQSTVVGVDAANMTARALLERFTSTADDNFINYSNAEYDELFQQAITCYDDAEQTELYKAMEKNLTEHAANVYIQDLADLVAMRTGLEGLQFYPIYVLDLSTVRFAE